MTLSHYFAQFSHPIDEGSYLN